MSRAKRKKSKQNEKKPQNYLVQQVSKLVKTNIGRIFIKLISKHFPPIQKSVKVINKNTLKLSYSCMSNIRSKAKVNGHNKKNTTSQAHRAAKIMQLPC